VFQKVVKKLSKNCQKVVKKLLKSSQKVIKKLSKKCQKVVKVVKKLSKSYQKFVKKKFGQKFVKNVCQKFVNNLLFCSYCPEKKEKKKKIGGS
jgi:predicted translin family RNA/ssDNA-binding protein